MIEENNKFNFFCGTAAHQEFYIIYENLKNYFSLPENQPYISPITGPDMILAMAFKSNTIIYINDVELKRIRKYIISNPSNWRKNEYWRCRGE